MAKYSVADIRNIALCGHGGSGKTTIADTILHETGLVKRLASVDDGTSICDFDEEEKAHKYTIEASVIHYEHAGKLFNMIDTPGYPDFIGQTIGALWGVDTAAIVINAQAGIEVNTRRVFAEAKKAGLGRMIVLNKMDNENVDYEKLIALIKDVFGTECVPLNVPIGQGHSFKGVASTLNPPADAAGALFDPQKVHENLIETIVTVDDAVMEKYLEGEVPSDEQLAELMKKAIHQGVLVPMICVSAKSKIGFKEMMDAFALCALPPDMIERKSKNAAGEECKSILARKITVGV